MANNDYAVATKQIRCMMGTTPGTFNLPVDHGVYSGPDKQPIANVMDFIPMVNIPQFGQCMLRPIPMGGFLPCGAPITVAPWMPGDPKYLVGGMPALTYNSKLICCQGGVICIQK